MRGFRGHPPHQRSPPDGPFSRPTVFDLARRNSPQRQAARPLIRRSVLTGMNGVERTDPSVGSRPRQGPPGRHARPGGHHDGWPGEERPSPA